MSFVHLHTHTEYSLLDGSNKIKSYVKKCKDNGMTAAAIANYKKALQLFPEAKEPQRRLKIIEKKNKKT